MVWETIPRNYFFIFLSSRNSSQELFLHFSLLSNSVFFLHSLIAQTAVEWGVLGKSVTLTLDLETMWLMTSLWLLTHGGNGIIVCGGGMTSSVGGTCG
jgi:hypothetical protein